MRFGFLALALVLAAPSYSQDASNPAQWRNWLSEIVKDIGVAHRQGNVDLLERRIRRPVEFLASAGKLPEDNNIRVHCTLAAQSAANYASSLRNRKVESARADLAEFRRYDEACSDAIHKPHSIVAAPQAPTSALSRNGRSPQQWLADVKADAENARQAARAGRENISVLSAVARSALAYRTQIQDWSPGPARSEAYGECGDAVIALARIDQRPRDAFTEYDRAIRACERSIAGR